MFACRAALILVAVEQTRGRGEVVFEKERDEGLMHEPRFQAEALSEACGLPTVHLALAELLADAFGEGARAQRAVLLEVAGWDARDDLGHA